MSFIFFNKTETADNEEKEEKVVKRRTEDNHSYASIF
jgi:hypothetical protein